MPLFDDRNRTEAPTPRRLREARREGSVARSQDLNVAILMLGGFAALAVFGESSLRGMGTAMTGLLRSMSELRIDGTSAVEVLAESMLRCLWIAAPFALAAFAAAIASNAAQVGFLFTPAPLAPNVARIDPMRGLSRLLSLRSVVRFASGIVKVAAIGAALAIVLRSELVTGRDGGLAALLYGDSAASASHGMSVVTRLGLTGAAALATLAAADFAYQKWQFRRDLMMTKQELREEMLMMDGDPKVREGRRRVQRSIAAQNMLKDVAASDVVITDTARSSIALRYRSGGASAPRCTAKGRGHAALRIREIAVANAVPLVERPELARALWRGVTVGGEVPPGLYRAVAEVLAYTYRLARRSRAPNEEAS